MIGAHLGESGHPKKQQESVGEERNVVAEEQKSGWKRGEFRRKAHGTEES